MDKNALEPILSELIDDTQIHFEIIRSDLSAYPENIELKDMNMKQRVNYVLKSYLERNRYFKKEYIDKIIFITDTDGCYIDNEHIHYSEDDEYFRYEDDGIYTNCIDHAINRNDVKRINLNTINSTAKIADVPIQVFYFSCNLDHVLHNQRNLKQELKEEYADEFADLYEDREEDFIDFVNDKNLALSNDYKESWEKIKQGCNSVLRHTNLNVFFIRNIELLNDRGKAKELIYMKNQ